MGASASTKNEKNKINNSFIAKMFGKSDKKKKTDESSPANNTKNPSRNNNNNNNNNTAGGQKILTAEDSDESGASLRVRWVSHASSDEINNNSNSNNNNTNTNTNSNNNSNSNTVSPPPSNSKNKSKNNNSSSPTTSPSQALAPKTSFIVTKDGFKTFAPAPSGILAKVAVNIPFVSETESDNESPCRDNNNNNNNSLRGPQQSQTLSARRQTQRPPVIISTTDNNNNNNYYYPNRRNFGSTLNTIKEGSLDAAANVSLPVVVNLSGASVTNTDDINNSSVNNISNISPRGMRRHVGRGKSQEDVNSSETPLPVIISFPADSANASIVSECTQARKGSRHTRLRRSKNTEEIILEELNHSATSTADQVKQEVEAASDSASQSSRKGASLEFDW